MDPYVDRPVADVEVELYTAAALVRGTISTRLRRISDILNLAGRSELVLTQARVDPLADATGSETFDTPELRVRLDEVLLALGGGEGERPPEVEVIKQPVALKICIGPFLLDGQFHLAPGTPPADAFFNPSDRFAPVTDAHLHRLGEPTSARHEPVVAVNRARVDLFAASGEPVGDPELGGYPSAVDARPWFSDR